MADARRGMKHTSPTARPGAAARPAIFFLSISLLKTESFEMGAQNRLFKERTFPFNDRYLSFTARLIVLGCSDRASATS